MAKRLIGTATTNANGVASVTYTGAGRGLLNVFAESGSLQSEIYEVYDCAWYYQGTDNTKASSWFNSNSYLQVSYSENGTKVTKTEANTEWRYYFYNDSTLSTVLVGNRYSIPVRNAIEFTVTEITGTIILDVFDNNNNHPIPQISETGVYKIVLDGSVMRLFKDGVERTVNPNTLNGTNVRFGFSLNAQNESITFKDMKIYPI